MLNNINVGTLVYDVSPYKAPELSYGIGIVVDIVDTQYVKVHWVEWDIISIENKINLTAVQYEDRRPSKT